MKNKLKAIREKCGLTAITVANQLNLTKAQMSYMETGKMLPNLKTALKMCELYKCQINDLFKDELFTYQIKDSKKATKEEKQAEFELLCRNKTLNAFKVGFNLLKLMNKLDNKPKENIFKRIFKKFKKIGGDNETN